jgi:hypothetical protein
MPQKPGSCVEGNKNKNKKQKKKQKKSKIKRKRAPKLTR